MSSVSWTSGLGPVRRPPLWGLWLLVFAAWLRVWSFHWLSNDDLNFAARAHRPPGPLAPSSVYTALEADITRRNGRSADVMIGIILNAPPWGITLILSVLCTLAGIAAWRWLRVIAFPSRPSPLADLLLAASSAAAPLAVTLFNPRHSRETVYFLSATAGYLIGPLFFFLATGPLIRQTLRGGVPRWRLYASVPFALAAAYHHEVLAMMMAGAVAGCLLLWQRTRWTAHTWTTAAAVFATVPLRLTAPGVWAKSIKLAGETPPTPTLRLSYAVRSATGFVQSAPILLIGLTIGVCLLGVTTLIWAEGGRRRSVILATASAGGFSILTLLATARAQTLITARPRGVIHTYPSAIAVLAALVLCSAALVWQCRLIDRTRPIRSSPWLPGLSVDEDSPLSGFTVLVGVFLGSMAIPLAVGGGSGRPTFLSAYLLALFVAAAGCFTVQNSRGPLREGKLVVPLSLLLACMTPIAGTQAWIAAQPGLEKNHRSWNEILRQIEEAKEGKRAVVDIPAAPPAPAFAGDWPSQAVSPYAFRVLYDVPEHVTIRVVKPAKKK